MTAAIVIDNKALTAVISASGSTVLNPPSRMQNPHPGVKWRVNADSAWILIDREALADGDTLALVGLAFGVEGLTPTFRVRYSTVDVTGDAGDVYDSGVISGTPYYDERFGKFVHLAPVGTSQARFRKIDVVVPGAEYIEAGIADDGVRESFGINYQTPWTISANDGSVTTIGTWGSTFQDLREGYWSQSISFGFASDTERKGFLRDMQVSLVNRGALDFLWIPDPDSDNLAADCIYGRHEGNIALTQSLYLVPPVWEVQFQVRQRIN